MCFGSLASQNMFNLVALSVCLLGLIIYLIFSFIKFLKKLWWTPLDIQHKLRAYGISGPSYRFMHGNTEEIMKMKKVSMSKNIGLSHDIFPRIHPHIHNWINTYGSNFLFWRGHEAQLVITESKLIKELINNKDGFPRPDMGKIMKKITGVGSIASEGQKWAKLRKVSNNSFHGDHLKNMIPSMVESVEAMLGRWKMWHTKEIEVCEELRLMTAEVISRTAFGSSYLEGEQIFKMLRKLTILSSRSLGKMRSPGFRIFQDNDDIEAERLGKDIRELIIEVIKRRESRVQANMPSTDFLGALVKAYHDPDKSNRITLDEVIDECKTFYTAGHGTTSTLLSWTIFLLAIHTDWQDKAREEALNVLGRQRPTSDCLARLKIINMIINETLRLYPPASMVGRKIKKEAKLGTLSIPANTNVNVPVLGLHHDQRIWGEDAHCFRPERFSAGVAKATNNNSTVFLPFGFGPRVCVGSNFAITEAKIALSMLLQNYSFTLSSNHIHSPAETLVLRPQHGILVILNCL